MFQRLDDGSRMSREAHVRFCEGQQVKFLWSTHPYIRTYDGWLYLEAVMSDVVGWSMKPTMATELALDALMTAIWRRNPKQPVIIHSDQGSPLGSDGFVRWCKDTDSHST